jgi:lipoate-protein ligase A
LTSPSPWAVTEVTGTAGHLHDAIPVPAVRAVRVCTVTAQAFVLGSAQRLPNQGFERAVALDLDVVRRRSGGGAVVLAPAAQVWVDVSLPRFDRLWLDDVSRSGWWLGDVWAAALGALGVAGAAVHTGAMVRTLLSDQVCFAGLAGGEVTVEGVKIVGVSQRRTREGAVFQCTLPLTWDPAPYVEVLQLSSDAAAEAVGVAAPLQGHDAAAVVAALLHELPSGVEPA